MLRKRSSGFSSADADASGPDVLDRNVALAETCGRAQNAPVFRNKRARNGDGSIVLYEWMKAGQFREDTEEVVRDGGARQIVDEPAERCVSFHPLQKADNIVVAEVMRDQRADDDIDGSVRRVGEDIARYPFDLAGGRSRLSGDGNGVWVDVNAGQLNIESACFGPAINAAQNIAIAAAHIENMEGRCG